MSIGLLLITHNQIGEALLQTASNMLGFCPLDAKTLDVSSNCNPDVLKEQAKDFVRQLNQGDGVLVLTDMYGSTPSNIAATLLEKGHVHVVAGINLPMLVRVLNYASLDLDDITNKAMTGGIDGIVRCSPGN